MTGTIRLTRMTWVRLYSLGVTDYSSFIAMNPDRIADCLNCSRGVVNRTKAKMKEELEAQEPAMTIGKPSKEFVDWLKNKPKEKEANKLD